MIIISLDIHVEAFVMGRRILQLNVTILSSMESTYDVIITSPSDEKEESSNRCKINHCVIHGIPQV